MSDAAVVTIHVKNRGPNSDVVPTNDRMFVAHKYCIKESFNIEFLSLLQSEIQKSTLPEKVI